VAEADIIIQKLGKQEDQAAEDRAISILVTVDLVTALVFHHHKVILVVLDKTDNLIMGQAVEAVQAKLGKMDQIILVAAQVVMDHLTIFMVHLVFILLVVEATVIVVLRLVVQVI
jgi:hypothetical protein